jgi:hypothetical protein
MAGRGLVRLGRTGTGRTVPVHATWWGAPWLGEARFGLAGFGFHQELPRLGLVRLGEARSGVAGYGKGYIRAVMGRTVTAHRNSVKLCMARHGWLGYGAVWFGFHQGWERSNFPSPRNRARRGQVGLSVVWLGRARSGTARHGFHQGWEGSNFPSPRNKTRPGLAGLGRARRGLAGVLQVVGCGWARLGEGGHGTAGLGLGSTRAGGKSNSHCPRNMAGLNRVRLGCAWHGRASARQGVARSGMAWVTPGGRKVELLPPTQQGTARRGRSWCDTAEQGGAWLGRARLSVARSG